MSLSSRPRILELAWATSDHGKAPQSIVVAFTSSSKKRRYRQDDEFRTYSDRIPIKFVQCANLDEAVELAYLGHSQPSAKQSNSSKEAVTVELIDNESPTYRSSQCLQDELHERLEESQKRHVFDEMIRQLRNLTLKRSRFVQDKQGRWLELIEVSPSHSIVEGVLEIEKVGGRVQSLQSPVDASPPHSGKRKREPSGNDYSLLETAIVDELLPGYMKFYYAMDVGFQKEVDTLVEATGYSDVTHSTEGSALPQRIESSIWRSKARNLFLEDFEHMTRAGEGAFLDIPTTIFDPLPEVYHRGVPEAYCEGLAVDREEDTYFDDYKDLNCDNDFDNRSIDYSSSNSDASFERELLSSSDQLSYDAISDDL